MIGQNKWAEWGTNDIVAWGFNAGANDGGVAGWDYWTYDSAFYGGFGDGGVYLSLYPVDALSINVGIPYERSAAKAADMYKYSHAQIQYNIADVGRIAVSYTGASNKVTGGGLDDEGNIIAPSIDAAAIYANFLLTMIQDIGLNFGFKFTLPASPDGGGDSVSSPMRFGVGFSYGSGDFGLKAKAQAEFGGEEGSPMSIAFDVLPYYNLSAVTVYLNAGVLAVLPDEGDTVIGFHINPYLSKSAGSGTFWAGFRLKSDGKNAAGDSPMYWDVPIGITFGF